MKGYKNLTIGEIYTVIRGQRVRRYLYKGRYINQVLKQWHYVFSSLDGFEYYTPPTKNTKVISL
jgi:hypothetical protein